MNEILSFLFGLLGCTALIALFFGLIAMIILLIDIILNVCTDGKISIKTFFKKK